LEKKEKYLQLLKQAKQLVDPKVGRISNMANLSRLLFDVFQHHWCGFYLVENGRLELGPFQGPIACTTIEKGKGVCGSSWEKRETLVIEVALRNIDSIFVTALVSGRETLVREVVPRNILNIFVTAPVFGRETLVIEVLLRNIRSILVTALVSEKLTLVIEVAPSNIYDISVTALVSQLLKSALKLVL